MRQMTLCPTCEQIRSAVEFPVYVGDVWDTCIFCIDKDPSLFPGGVVPALRSLSGFTDAVATLAAKHTNNIPMTEDNTHKPSPAKSLPTTGDIVADLNDYIIGQNQAKRVLAIALRNHLLRAENDDDDSVELKKSNVLLVGPTGSGKTAIVNRLAKIAGVDVIRINAADYTEAGYVGKDVAEIPKLVLSACRNNVARAERAIVYIDEIDKKRAGNGTSRDVSGVGVQQALLKLIEGGVDDLPFDIGKVLFIFSGAFAGIEDIIRERLTKEGKLRDRSIGFTAADKITATGDELLQNLTNADLCAFGMVPEFSGRVPAKAVLFTLTEDQLVEVLRATANSPVRQLEAVADMEGATLEVTEAALRWFAHAAIARGTGARGLEEVIEEALEDYKFNLGNGDYDGMDVTIDAVDGQLQVTAV